MKNFFQITFLFSFVFLTGCQTSTKAILFFNKHIGPVFGVKLESLNPASAPIELSGIDEKRKRNTLFLKELYSVVLLQEITEADFKNWFNVLEQDGSYEGIYNGVANGDAYRLKETGVAAPEAIRLYAKIMGKFFVEIKYDSLTMKAKKHLEPGQREEEAAKEPSENEKNKAISDMAPKAINRPLMTLKKEVAKEALHVMELKQEYKDKFATWFAKFALEANEYKTDFGMPYRNKGTQDEFYQWALNHNEDEVKWEILNRIHRLFNAAQEK